NYRGSTVGPAGFDPYVLTVDPTQLLQRLNKSCMFGARFRVVHGHKYGNQPHPLALLGSRRQRPCRRDTNKRDELAPPHSITSSARASSDCGTVRSSAFAVLRLITNSYLVGACTGRSAGFSPLRIRST